MNSETIEWSMELAVAMIDYTALLYDTVDATRTAPSGGATAKSLRQEAGRIRQLANAASLSDAIAVLDAALAACEELLTQDDGWGPAYRRAHQALTVAVSVLRLIADAMEYGAQQREEGALDVLRQAHTTAADAGMWKHPRGSGLSC